MVFNLDSLTQSWTAGRREACRFLGARGMNKWHERQEGRYCAGQGLKHSFFPCVTAVRDCTLRSALPQPQPGQALLCALQRVPQVRAFTSLSLHQIHDDAVLTLHACPMRITRCVFERGEDHARCQFYQKAYQGMCPADWVSVVMVQISRGA